MKQPSRKQCIRESHSAHSSGNLDHVLLSIDEEQSFDTSAAATLTNVTNNIERHATRWGFATKSRWLTDGAALASVVTVQLGHRRAFPDSEEISVRIFDDDNIKIILTNNIVLVLGDQITNNGAKLEQLATFKLTSLALSFLESVYNGVVRVSPDS